MKRNVFRVDWLIPVLGIVLVLGGYSLTKSYHGALEDIRLGQQFNAIIDRLTGDCRLSRVLSEAQAAGCAVTAQSLDELLATDMATLNAELQSAEPQARALAEACFEYIARRRHQNAPLASQLATPRLGERTLASAAPGN